MRRLAPAVSELVIPANVWKRGYETGTLTQDDLSFIARAHCRHPVLWPRVLNESELHRRGSLDDPLPGVSRRLPETPEDFHRHGVVGSLGSSVAAFRHPFPLQREGEQPDDLAEFVQNRSATDATVKFNAHFDYPFAAQFTLRDSVDKPAIAVEVLPVIRVFRCGEADGQNALAQFDEVREPKPQGPEIGFRIGEPQYSHIIGSSGWNLNSADPTSASAGYDRNHLGNRWITIGPDYDMAIGRDLPSSYGEPGTAAPPSGSLALH
jgi:hypothetical protein